MTLTIKEMAAIAIEKVTPLCPKAETIEFDSWEREYAEEREGEFYFCIIANTDDDYQYYHYTVTFSEQCELINIDGGFIDESEDWD